MAKLLSNMPGLLGASLLADETRRNVDTGTKELQNALEDLVIPECQEALKKADLFDIYTLTFSQLSSNGKEIREILEKSKWFDWNKRRKLHRRSIQFQANARNYSLDVWTVSGRARLGLNIRDGTLMVDEPIREDHPDVNTGEQSDSNYDSDSIYIGTDGEREIALDQDASADGSSDTRSLHSISSSIFGNPWLKNLDAIDEADTSTSGVATPVAMAFSTTNGSEENRTDENKDSELLGVLVLRNF